MDYKDYLAGVKPDQFWFKGKLQFISILLSTLNIKKSVKILNVGAGTGEDLSVIHKYGDVYVVDINKNALDFISKDLVVEKRIADVCSLPYKDNFFDLVIAFDVLEHVENDSQAVSEIYRVLKSDGLFVFTVPAFNFLFCKRDEYLNHYRRYNKKQIKKLLVNFKFLSLNSWFFFLFLPSTFFILFLPERLQRLINNKIVLQRNGNGKIFGFIHFLFIKIINFENWLVSKNIKFPFGLSIYGICKKFDD